MAVRKRTYSGSTSKAVTERELAHREISRKAAAEGVVLLKNDGLLPLAADKKLAVFGNGISNIIKGGTGSGDVNVRGVVSVLEGLDAAGYDIVNRAEAEKFIADWEASENVRRENIMRGLAECSIGSDMSFFKVIATAKGTPVEAIPVIPAQLGQADAVLFVISRVAGEGRDRHAEPGDYYLTDSEKNALSEIAKHNKNIVIIVNTGGQIHLADCDAEESVRAIVYISQPGMEAGHVIADVISGKVNPSGRLTATWTHRYEDFANAATFSHCNGNVDSEYYNDGIYVGYRYFDTFGVKPLYPFGYGLSYTEFEITPKSVTADGNTVTVTAEVKNTGALAGRQVVQVYAACPQTALAKELRRLVGFAKTAVLAPGESETVTVTAQAKDFASYHYDKGAWLVEKGEYAIFTAESSVRMSLAGVLEVAEDVVLEQVAHICPLETELEEISPCSDALGAFTAEWRAEAQVRSLEAVPYAPAPAEPVSVQYNAHFDKAMDIAKRMSDDELIAMLMGEMTKGQENIRDGELVETGIFVPGAAGETSCRFEEKYDIPAVSLADGPAGLRVLPSYDVDNKTGLIYGQGLLSALDGGMFAAGHDRPDATTYYMYTTAIPVGTMLAQTWDSALLERVGAMVGEEMTELGVTWWLAPGMNIQRNPLCGRNFEYYSEDPLVSGVAAAAITKGVQSVKGCATTIKHFACNNLEDNRLHSDSIVSERALREIYLRGFEIAIKDSAPMCIMSSYNKVNGIATSNSRGLCTTAAREEWGFAGIIMTDWTTTTLGCSTAYKCVAAGNDLIMPGNQKDVENIAEALRTGTLDRAEAELCAARLISVILACTE